MTFQEEVYKITKTIPMGKVATYGQIARLAGHPKAARAVGGFMKRNPYVPPRSGKSPWGTPFVPCHRVVASDGSLTGYSGVGGVKQKKEMLIKEGVVFKGDKVNLEISAFQK